ncbi:MAG TPA: hypothetical protein V6D17_22505, partial [Candidatus Obscuribacterales bacterium]
AEVKSGEEVKPGAEVKAGEEVKPGAEVKAGEEVKPGAEVKAGEEVKPGAEVKSGEEKAETPRGPKKPKRGPALTLDKVGGVDYQTNTDGTIVRRTEVMGKVLVGNETTWRELLTEAEQTALKERRAELEKLEAAKKITEEQARELVALRDVEAKLHDPATHKAVIERMGGKRPSGGFKAGELRGGVVGGAILLTAVLGWFVSGQKQEGYTPPSRASVGGVQ